MTALSIFLSVCFLRYGWPSSEIGLTISFPVNHQFSFVFLSSTTGVQMQIKHVNETAPANIES